MAARLVRSRALARVVALIAALGSLAAAGAERATLDAVDVQRVDDELVGVRDGASSLRVALQKRERVLWTGARGTVGVALTDRRFLAFSTRSAQWQELRFGREDVAPRVWLGANLALCVTPRRVLHFAGGPGLIGETSLSPSEQTLSVEVDEHVGVVVSDRRVLGFSSDATSVAERSLFVQERFESLSTRATSSSVRTSQRLLVYKRTGGGWFEER
jgi:hypothetical protein